MAMRISLLASFSLGFALAMSLSYFYIVAHQQGPLDPRSIVGDLSEMHESRERSKIEEAGESRPITPEPSDDIVHNFRDHMPPILCGYRDDYYGKPNLAKLDDVDYFKVADLCKTAGNGQEIDGVRCCNYSRASKWFLDHQKNVPEKNHTDHFINLLREFAYALHSADIPFHLMGGTLLGWERECGVIGHTTDIDIGVLEENWDRHKIADAVAKRGFEFYRCMSYEGYGFEMTFRYKNDTTKVDVREMVREKYHTFMGAGQTQFSRHARWEGHYRVVPAEFHGIPVGVPNDPARYLSLEYGDEYMQPVRDFKWDKSARNLFDGLPRFNTAFRKGGNMGYCTLSNGGDRRKM